RMLDPERRFERQRVAGAAVITLGRDDGDLREILDAFGERSEASRQITVVVGHQNAHTPFPGIATNGATILEASGVCPSDLIGARSLWTAARMSSRRFAERCSASSL